MPRTALVTDDQLPFTEHLATLLRGAGEEVTVFLARPTPGEILVDPAWYAGLESRGIDLVTLEGVEPSPDRFPNIPVQLLSERLAPLIGGFDAVYFQDRGNLAFSTLRQRRFAPVASPACVTVLLGPTAWERLARRCFQFNYDDPCNEYIEAYCARHGGFVASPTRHMAEWAQGEGWVFPEPGGARVLGLPMVPVETGPPVPSSSSPLKRILCWVSERRPHGAEGFVQALEILSRRWPGLALEVFLPGPGHLFDTPPAARLLDQVVRRGYRVLQGSPAGSADVVPFLKAGGPGTLAVIPDPLIHFSYRAITALSIPGLDVLVPRCEGISELLSGCGGLPGYVPTPGRLADQLERRVMEGCNPAGRSGVYDPLPANRRWLEFHAEVLSAAPHRRPNPVDPEKPPVRAVRPFMDICIPYFNKGRHLPQLLLALERQTVPDFTVIVVDDGSTEAASRRVFEEMKQRYAARGWTFVSQENTFADEARNAAARLGRGECIAFIDADDVPAATFVEKLSGAMRRTGDDCLTVLNYLFKGEDFPYDLDTGAPLCPPAFLYTPLGAAPVVAMVDPNVLGGIGLCIRRPVFEALGGFKRMYGATHEDYEIHIRLAMAGYRTDVLPEYLYFYRIVEDGVAQNIDRFRSMLRLAKVYEEALAPVGLRGAAMKMIAMQQYIHDLEFRLRERDALVERLAGHESRIFPPPPAPETPPVDVPGPEAANPLDSAPDAKTLPADLPGPETAMPDATPPNPREPGLSPPAPGPETALGNRGLFVGLRALRWLYHHTIPMPARIRARNARVRLIGR